MKRKELRIELIVSFNEVRTKKQKAALQSWIAETLEDRLSDCTDGETSDADHFEVGSMFLTSEAGVDEVSA